MEVAALLGQDQLGGVELSGRGRPQTWALAVRGLFVFIGAEPSTQWLARQLTEDTHGYLLTGSTIPEARLDDRDRTPLFLETSRPGVFAVGDARSGSVKRAATATGEGSMAVRLVFERLQATGSAIADPPRADTGASAPALATGTGRWLIRTQPGRHDNRGEAADNRLADPPAGEERRHDYMVEPAHPGRLPGRGATSGLPGGTGCRQGPDRRCGRRGAAAHRTRPA